MSGRRPRPKQVRASISFVFLLYWLILTPVYETVEYNRAKKKKKKAPFTHCFELVDLANSSDFFHQKFFSQNLPTLCYQLIHFVTWKECLKIIIRLISTGILEFIRGKLFFKLQSGGRLKARAKAFLHL